MHVTFYYILLICSHDKNLTHLVNGKRPIDEDKRLPKEVLVLLITYGFMFVDKNKNKISPPTHTRAHTYHIKLNLTFYSSFVI